MRSTRSAFRELSRMDPARGSSADPAALTSEEARLLSGILATPRQEPSVSRAFEVTRTEQGRLLRHWPRSLLIGAAAVSAVALVSSAIGLSLSSSRTGSSPTQRRTLPVLSRWRLTASLVGSQFQLGTGNPDAVVGVSCGTGSTCFLSTGYGLDYGGGGGMWFSHDGGHSWSPSPLPANTAISTLTSCPSATWCAAGAGLLDSDTGDPGAGKPMRDPELMVTSDGGRSWTSHPVPLPVAAEQIPPYGSLPAETTYWPGEVDAVSCSAPDVCDVLGQTQAQTESDQLYFLRTTDGGAHWTSTPLPSPFAYQLVLAPGSSETMSCPTTQDCVVLASLLPGSTNSPIETWRTTNGGLTWQRSPIDASPELSMSCPDVRNCWIANGATPLHSSDGGETWSTVSIPASLISRNDTDHSATATISCTSSEVCFESVGATILETTDGGTVWQRDSLPSQVGSVIQVTCQQNQYCAAIADPADSVSNQFDGGSLVLTDEPL